VVRLVFRPVLEQLEEEDNMPIYEYKCQKCSYKFEELVFEEREIKCPKCGSKFLEKLISLPNIGKKSSNNEDGSCPTCKWQKN
jgi:putative FmdB family regulatory protein